VTPRGARIVANERSPFAIPAIAIAIGIDKFFFNGISSAASKTRALKLRLTEESAQTPEK